VCVRVCACVRASACNHVRVGMSACGCENARLRVCVSWHVVSRVCRAGCILVDMHVYSVHGCVLCMYTLRSVLCFSSVCIILIGCVTAAWALVHIAPQKHGWRGWKNAIQRGTVATVGSSSSGTINERNRHSARPDTRTCVWTRSKAVPWLPLSRVLSMFKR